MWPYRCERERRELEQRHTRIVDQLENRIASLDVQNRDLLEVILHLTNKEMFLDDKSLRLSTADIL
jgi:hypothetical protein